MNQRCQDHQVTALNYLNENLSHMVLPLSQRLWSTRAALESRVSDTLDWVNDIEYDCILAFTNSSLTSNQTDDSPNVACLVTDFYQNLEHFQQWYAFDGWHNDLYSINDAYPVSGRHAIWFHALYDHSYGQNKLSWAELSQLDGCFLDEKIYLQRVSSLAEHIFVPKASDTKHAFIASYCDEMDGAYLALRRLNQFLTQAEDYCREELTKQFTNWHQRYGDQHDPLFDYDMLLAITGIVGENHPSYSDQNHGEIHLLDLPLASAKHGKYPFFDAIGDGYNHNSMRSAKYLRDSQCFLYDMMTRNAHLLDNELASIETIWVDIVTRKKTWLINGLINTEHPIIAY